MFRLTLHGSAVCFVIVLLSYGRRGLYVEVHVGGVVCSSDIACCEVCLCTHGRCSISHAARFDFVTHGRCGLLKGGCIFSFL